MLLSGLNLEQERLDLGFRGFMAEIHKSATELWMFHRDSFAEATQWRLSDGRRAGLHASCLGSPGHQPELRCSFRVVFGPCLNKVHDTVTPTGLRRLKGIEGWFSGIPGIETPEVNHTQARQPVWGQDLSQKPLHLFKSLRRNPVLVYTDALICITLPNHDAGLALGRELTGELFGDS